MLSVVNWLLQSNIVTPVPGDNSLQAKPPRTDISFAGQPPGKPCKTAGGRKLASPDMEVLETWQ